MKYAIFFLVLNIVIVFGPRQAQGQDSLKYSIFLLGDAGQVGVSQQRVLELVKKQANLTGKNSTILFLGDNIYPNGMPNKDNKYRGLAEKQIDAQIGLLDGYEGDFYFIPGNHGWKDGEEGGKEYLKNQERYIENVLKRNAFLPDDGCPGPVSVSMPNNIELIIIDSHWVLQNMAHPDREQNDCLSDGPVEVLQLLDDLLNKNKDKRIVVAMHHPLYSYGNHGSFNTLKDHIFPLTQIYKPLFIPLPVIGSLGVWLRSAIANEQDLAHPKYKEFRDALTQIFSKYPNLIHVSGHDHLLEFIKKDSVNYIVSGSASRVSGKANATPAEYAESTNGFARLNFYNDGSVSVEFWKSDDRSIDGVLSFERMLFKKPSKRSTSEVSSLEDTNSFSDSAVTKASSQYQTQSKFKLLMLGKNYRDEWQHPLKVPVFNIGEEHGGLKIVQRGGGMQTKSLRLEAENGKQYTLRSIEKYPENAVPEFLRKTFAADLVQDQISSSHPYGAFVVPYLAEAAGIYHTNPKLVYIPNDPGFGVHREDFANTLALYEERPDDDWSDAPYFGNSDKIISTSKVLEKLADDNDNIIDQKFVLKSRLFDLLIGDWDRHDDQWRWASFEDKNGKGKFYRPIPRDRDQAFFVNEGVLPSLVSRKWALPKLEGFDYDIRWPSGLMFNARYFDRSFLTGLSRQDWVDEAAWLKERLTDEVIEQAIRKWPDSIYQLHGREIIEKLKTRRNGLQKYALEHYLFLARVVDVVGSNKYEHFKAIRFLNGDVHIVVKKMKKNGDDKQIIFDRLFKYDETKEIRLYGLDGADEFEIEGKSKKGIKIRVIGGSGQDELDDDSHVSGWSHRNIFYDTDSANIVKLNKESRTKFSNTEEKTNFYNRKAFKYDVLMPLITGNINPDDGLFLGGGFLYTKHGFRKEPFKSKHMFLGSYALKTSSFNFKYEGNYNEVIGKWSLNTSADVKRPNYVNNFFGLGNEAEYDRNVDEQFNLERPIDYYRLRFQEVSTDIGLSRPVGTYSTFSFSHLFQSVEIVGSNKPRFIKDFNSITDKELIDVYRNYMGGRLHYSIEKRDNKIFPTSGVSWDNDLSLLTGIHDCKNTFASYYSTLALYYNLTSKLTIATRIGGGANFGDYEFYQSQILDGKSELRGFRKTRFYGNSKLFNNLEVRWNVLSFRTYIFPASFGILAFNDVGRVWIDEEDSKKWHHGFGGGVWLSPFNLAVLSAEIGHSEEETLLYVRLGFLF